MITASKANGTSYGYIPVSLTVTACEGEDVVLNRDHWEEDLKDADNFPYLSGTYNSTDPAKNATLWKVTESNAPPADVNAGFATITLPKFEYDSECTPTYSLVSNETETMEEVTVPDWLVLGTDADGNVTLTLDLTDFSTEAPRSLDDVYVKVTLTAEKFVYGTKMTIQLNPCGNEVITSTWTTTAYTHTFYLDDPVPYEPIEYAVADTATTNRTHCGIDKYVAYKHNWVLLDTNHLKNFELVDNTLYVKGGYGTEAQAYVLRARSVGKKWKTLATFTLTVYPCEQAVAGIAAASNKNQYAAMRAADSVVEEGGVISKVTFKFT